MIRQYFNDLLSLLYPHNCSGCSKPLVGNEVAICTTCRVILPRTNTHLIAVTELSNKFAGKLPIEHVYAFLRFERGSKVQRLLHQLKYRNKPEVGVELGKIYGKELKDTDTLTHFDLITAIPLHQRKKQQRGYNQSDMFAKGLSESLTIDWVDDILIRTKFTETQTRKSRIQRFENVNQIFEVSTPEKVRGKNIILVDDVITTGSTLEAAATTLLENDAKQIAIIAIAAAY